MQFDEDQLTSALKEFAFDVQQFRCYVEMHRNGTLNHHPTVAQAVRYALLLHMRVILDFFYGPPREDGVGVGHFRRTLPNFGAKFRKIKVPTPSEISDVRINLHKRLAHLTATRWEKRPPSMNYYAKHFDSLDTLLKIFHEALPDSMKADFTRAMRRWANPPKV